MRQSGTLRARSGRGVGRLAAIAGFVLLLNSALGAATTDVGASSTTTTVPLSSSAEFLSPSGNVSCEVDWHRAGLTEVYCQTLRPPRSVTMSANGTFTTCSGVSCLGNPADNAPTLAYGHATGAGPFRCDSTASAVICTVSGRGFSISRSGVTKIAPRAPTTPTTLANYADPPQYSALVDAAAIGKLIAIDRSGENAEFLISCGRTAANKPLTKSTRWTVSLKGVTFGEETNPTDPGAGSVVALSRPTWVARARLHGWSGFLYLDRTPRWLTDGPGTNVCAG